ncbi:protein rep [Streptomyces sp. NPDC057794]|uniref:protein rep n=2 Tax=Streptomyces TaxID=1883 RepID=UPI00368FC865
MGSVEHTADPARDDEAETDSYGELETTQVRQDLKGINARRQVSRPRPGRRHEGGSRAASGGLAEGPTRYNANNVSPSQENPSSEAESDVRQERRGTRFAQREALWSITSLDRVRKCGRTTNGNVGDGLAAVVVNGSVAHWSGFCTCGSIWACPVCSAKIRATRADEIARAVAAHMTRDGGTAWMVTLTARHKKHHDLAPLFDAVANGWRKLMSGKAWAGDKKRGQIGERDRLGVRGNIRSMEVTYGTRNGWHPHLHVVLLLESEDPLELAKAIVRWDKTWRAWMKKAGFEPSQEHGVNWTKVTTPAEAGEYIAKVQEGKGHLGNEMARGDMKSGRLGTLAPFELLEYFRQTGDMAVVPIWQEYEKGTHRRRAITWSRGLRAQLLGDEAELSDEEVAAEEVGGETWAVLPAESLRAIRRVPGLQARILDAAENGGFIELVNLLTAYHLAYEVGPDAPKNPVPAAS